MAMNQNDPSSPPICQLQHGGRDRLWRTGSTRSRPTNCAIREDRSSSGRLGPEGHDLPSRVTRSWIRGRIYNANQSLFSAERRPASRDRAELSNVQTRLGEA